jgi:hypothetical protein
VAICPESSDVLATVTFGDHNPQTLTLRRGWTMIGPRGTGAPAPPDALNHDNHKDLIRAPARHTHPASMCRELEALRLTHHSPCLRGLSCWSFAVKETIIRQIHQLDWEVLVLSGEAADSHASQPLPPPTLRNPFRASSSVLPPPPCVARAAGGMNTPAQPVAGLGGRGEWKRCFFYRWGEF